MNQIFSISTLKEFYILILIIIIFILFLPIGAFIRVQIKNPRSPAKWYIFGLLIIELYMLGKLIAFYMISTWEFTIVTVLSNTVGFFSLICLLIFDSYILIY